MITNITIAIPYETNHEILLLNRTWDLYMTATTSSFKWKTTKINQNKINTVNELWSCLNMFFIINHNPLTTCPLDLENSSRKELSFFQHDVYPNWNKVKSSKKCKKLQELKISCNNSNQEFILYVILALAGETFGSTGDESYIQNIYGIRICPYKKPSVRLWLGDFTPDMSTILIFELKKIWRSLYKTKFHFSMRDLF